MKFKNIGVITSIKQSLKSKEITIRLDNYLDDEKYNVIFLCDKKLGAVNSTLLLGTQLLVKDDFLFDIKRIDVQTNKKYEFEFQIVDDSNKKDNDNNINTALPENIEVNDLKELIEINEQFTLEIISITEKVLV